MKRVFAPGCALMIYKPDLADSVHRALIEEFGNIELVTNCCKHKPNVTSPAEIINICPGCDKRYSSDYENISTISLWEILSESNSFKFPDYHGMKMTIHDACPTREKDKVHTAIRDILSKMNIVITEPKNTRMKSTCCGDTFYGLIPVEDIKKQMIKRASEMPLDDVVVYCVSCIKSLHIGAKKPRYLVDLLFQEDTLPMTYEPDEWHKELSDYIENH
jgi:Fe-S oxidoreductase